MTKITVFPISTLLIFAILMAAIGFVSYTNHLINNFDHSPVRRGPEHQVVRDALMNECRIREKGLIIFRNRGVDQYWPDNMVTALFDGSLQVD